MSGGWFKFHRKTLESSVWDDHNTFRLWVWCLMKASYMPCKEVVRTEQVDLEPGQFIFSRAMASQQTGLSEQSIRTCLKLLEKMENLTIKSTNRFSVISIVNWDIYQLEKESANQQSNQQVTSNQPASNQQPLISSMDARASEKEVKKEKNQNHDSSEPLSRSKPEAHPEPAFISIHLVDNTEHPVTESQVLEFEAAYPAVDVRQQLREMRTWCIANPKRRKTKRGVLSFVNSWLAREQDRGVPARASPKDVAPKDESEGRRRLFMKVPDEEKRWYVDRYKDVLTDDEIRRYAANG